MKKFNEFISEADQGYFFDPEQHAIQGLANKLSYAHQQVKKLLQTPYLPQNAKMLAKKAWETEQLLNTVLNSISELENIIKH